MLNKKPGFSTNTMAELQRHIDNEEKDEFWQKLREIREKFPQDWAPFSSIIFEIHPQEPSHQFYQSNSKLEPGLPHLELWKRILAPEKKFSLAEILSLTSDCEIPRLEPSDFSSERGKLGSGGYAEAVVMVEMQASNKVCFYCSRRQSADHWLARADQF
jgi:hypothetical protein